MKERKNIVVICPSPIFPITMGSQVRMYNLIKALSKYHNVDVITKVTKEDYHRIKHHDDLSGICLNHYLIQAPNKKSYLNRMFYYILNKLNNKPRLLFYNSIKPYVNKLAQIINSNKYDIINCEYWYTCTFYNKLKYKPFLALDTHNVNYHRLLKEKINKKEVEIYRKYELKYTKLNDLIISVSEDDYQFFKKKFPNKENIKIPIGQDLTNFLNYKKKDNNNKTVLFYGNFIARYNRDGFFRLINYIIPLIRKKVNDIKVIALGANPSEEMKKLHDNKNIIITGYVKDIKPWIAQSSIMILPLETAIGFRVRAVEVMAMGVPVIGTHDALSCLEIQNAKEGYISDSDKDLANFAINLLTNHKLNKTIADEARNHVCEKFSLPATYNELSIFYKNL